MASSTPPATAFAAAWVASMCTKNVESCRWAFDALSEASHERQFDLLWNVVVAIAELEQELDTETLAVVAAGPLEDLLCHAGPDFIDRVEHAAKFNHRMGRLLTGVWKSSIDPAVWERVVRFGRAFPEPIDEVYGY